MKIIRGIQQIRQRFPRTIVAIGVFDGLHQGHCHLIRETVRRARACQGTAVVMTFHPHPVHVLRPDVYLPLLISFPQRLRLIKEMGVDVCVVVPFTKRFSLLSPEQFVQRYLVRALSPATVIVGDDFRFGHDRTGTMEFFREAARRYGFQVHFVPTSLAGKKTISSTNIRGLIASGDIPRAAKLLGRPVSLVGKVVHGQTRGQKMGYPTANINPPELVILPTGVFIVRIEVRGQVYPGIANVGHRPSFKEMGRLNIEVHLLDFHKNLYGQELRVDFLKKIRDEQMFWSQQELVSHIQRDEGTARAWFRKHPLAGSPSKSPRTSAVGQRP